MSEELQEIVRQMEGLGFMRKYDHKSVIWHWDFSARNILIDLMDPVTEISSCNIADTGDTASRTQAAEWIVSGVIGWDEVKSVPLVLSRKPPYWLWADEEDRSEGWLVTQINGPRRCAQEKADQ